MARTPCNRDRKQRFILSFGRVKGVGVGNEGVCTILYDYGLEAFEEWAIDLMVADLVQSARAGIKRNIENRKAYEAFARRSEQVALASPSHSNSKEQVAV